MAVQRFRPLLGLLAFLVATPAPCQRADVQAWLRDALAASDRGQVPFMPAPDAYAADLARWDRLRRPDAVATLAEYADFVRRNPAWPGTTAMRRRAELLAADPSRTGDSEALAFFAALPPQTPGGNARLAAALFNAGRAAEGRAFARAAWTGGWADPAREPALLQQYAGAMDQGDHRVRADRLLWAGATTAAGRMLNLLDPQARALAEARLALKANAPDAEARAASVSAGSVLDAGLVLDRVNWLDRRGRRDEASRLLANAPVRAGATDPVVWLNRRLELGRAAMRAGDDQLAYRLFANHRAFALGRGLNERTLGERAAFSDAEWLAGWIALRRLNRPSDALVNFRNFRASVLTPVSQSRGDYWIGRAFAALGDRAGAQAAYADAAAHPDYFYGQLAAEALGRTPALPALAPPAVTDLDRAAFAADPLARAVIDLGAMGDRSRQSLFMRALAENAATPAAARLAADLGRRVDRPDLAVRVAREARSVGTLALIDMGFPRLDDAALTPDRWVISHAIARQESFFDRTAESSVGARGLMQLMPGTASDVARRLGLPYDQGRLFSDPSYNLTLGGSYIMGRVNDFDGNRMMAIAAYNAGAGNVRRWLALNGDPRGRGVEAAVDWIEMIPFTETRNYVQRVTENAVVYSLLEPRRADAEPRASAWLGA